MGVAKVHVRCGVTVRASIGMLGLRMCGAAGSGGGAGVRGLVLATACVYYYILYEACAYMVEAGVWLG